MPDNDYPEGTRAPLEGRWPEAAALLFPVTRGRLTALEDMGTISVWDGSRRLFTVSKLALVEARTCLMAAEADAWAERIPPSSLAFTSSGLRCLAHGTGPVPRCPPSEMYEAYGVPHLLTRSGLGLMTFEATSAGWADPLRHLTGVVREWWVIQTMRTDL